MFPSFLEFGSFVVLVLDFNLLIAIGANKLLKLGQSLLLKFSGLFILVLAYLSVLKHGTLEQQFWRLYC